ncbi:hypothetical protein Cni_G00873 [Canna indica]|uniref:Uncharacterized protein n=1 Tax=Canna indica TaxID=4628 RepID=A0AAQ3Q138_9LILI|nr:hypothetical protein Cni_G00873 [Canna indica]
MSIAATSACSQNPLTALLRRRIYQLPVCANRVKFGPLFPSSYSSPPRHLVPAVACSTDAFRWRTGASSSSGFDGSPVRSVPGHLSLDQLLFIAEVLCIAPPTIYSIACVVSSVIPGASKQFQVYLGSKAFLLQYFLLVGAVAIGSLIRWRQWQRICMVNENGVRFDLIERIEKVEEDLRSSATIIRVLSRQLEKLGIRFRVTRKGVKEPIAETAALAQKNSEATRALAMQEEILEKELGEIQKVLLAMQEQQQKQLELILAIGKAGRLLDMKSDSSEEQSRTGTNSSFPGKKEAIQIETQPERHAGGDNDRSSTTRSDHLL